MKADKLFLLINEIDDRLIDDAERADDSPIEIEYEPKRFRIKEIIALAACAAVLVFGVITVVKLRIGGIDTPPDSGANSEYSESINDTSDSSETSETSETGEVILTVDREFPEILQIKLLPGSFEDALRHIILSSQTVEELESRIAEIGGRVSEVKVTKKTNKIEYLKGGEPVTEGSIEKDMFVRVWLDDGVWYTYWVGYTFESSQRHVGISDGSDFTLALDFIAREAGTFGGFIAAISEHDDYKRMEEIHLYRNLDDYNNGIETVGDDTVLEDGMYFQIIYEDGKKETIFGI